MIPSISSEAANWESLEGDRLPPHSPEAEMGVLGCVLLAPDESMPECIEAIQGGPVFYDLRHMAVYDAMLALYDRNVKIDMISVGEELKRNDMLDSVGGFQYLSSLDDTVPSAQNLPYYLEILIEKFTLRNLLTVCTETAGEIYEFKTPYRDFLDKAIYDINRVVEPITKVGMKPIRDLVASAINDIEERFENKGRLTGITTGFSDLDRLTSGLQRANMIVLAARPSMGKSAIALNIAEVNAIDFRIPVGVFSLEMSAESLVKRSIASRARVNLKDINDGFLAERDFPRITNAAAAIQRAPLYIDDTGGLTIEQLRAKAKRMSALYGIKLFVIDYLQLLRCRKRRNNRQEEISDISSGIKALAKELDVPIIILAQLNRDLEKDGKRKPRLSDLRESGSIEQDADLVGLLYKPKIFEEEEENYNSDSIAVNLLVAKQRNGPTGDIPLTFLRGYTRFENASKIDDSDVAQYPTQTEMPMKIDEAKV